MTMVEKATYRWKGEDIETLSPEEAVKALRWCLDFIRELQDRPVDYRAMVRARMSERQTAEAVVRDITDE